MEKDAEVIGKVPGCLSMQLHRGVGNSGIFMNYAVWSSMEDYRKMTMNLNTIRNNEQRKFPESLTISPYLFEKVTV
jgi:hypothetical protein